MTGLEAQAALMEGIIPSIHDPVLVEVCQMVVTNPEFVKACGSAGEHHCYLGGLAIHTLEVATYAYGMAIMFPLADKDVVLTAAIFHDYMKIKEYEVLSTQPVNSPILKKTDYRKLVRHVAGSHAEFMKAISDKAISPATVLKIEHAILAHHGRYEWGSPIEPQTVEAFILHFADQLSVHCGSGLEGVVLLPPLKQRPKNPHSY